MATNRYTDHPGGPAEFDRIRGGRNKWLCLACRKDTIVDPRHPGNCPHCGTPYWHTHVDTNLGAPTMQPYMKSYHTSDPSVSVDDRDVIVRYEGGWRWFIIRTIDGYPVAKGQPHHRPDDAETDFLSLFEAFSNGIIKPEIDRRLEEMGAIAKQDPRTRKIATLRDMLAKSKGEIEKALPRHIKAEYMLRVVMTSIQINPELLQCDPKSVLECVMKCSQLGLTPDGIMGEAYLIPFKDRKAGVTRCTLIPGYRGLQELARRSGYVTKIFARNVHANDRFRYEEGINPTLEHTPASGELGVTVGYYAVAHFRDRSIDPQFIYMSRSDVDAHRKRFASSRSGPWDSDYDAMARKTAIRKLCNELPKARELQDLHAAIEAEEKSIEDVEWSAIDTTHEQLTDESEAVEGAEPQDATQPEPERDPTVAVAWFAEMLNKCGTIKEVGDTLKSLDTEYDWLPAEAQDEIRQLAADVKDIIRSANAA